MLFRSHLVYYTPDTSFLHNQSRFFNQTLQFYDRVITTKSLEVPEFQRRMSAERLLLTTQSYDQQLHYPRVPFQKKRKEAVLIGLCEASRERCVAALLEAGQVYINEYQTGAMIEAPFGGYKMSGYGREKGVEALHCYTQVKCVTVKL